MCYMNLRLLSDLLKLNHLPDSPMATLLTVWILQRFCRLSWTSSEAVPKRFPCRAQVTLVEARKYVMFCFYRSEL
jgi:hypothetical protein